MREEILERADRQIRQGGFAQLNFAPIAESLETTRANLHYHFGSKGALADAVVERYVSQSVEAMAAILDAHPGDLPSALVAVESAIIERVERMGPRLTCVCGQLLRDATAPEHLRAEAREFFATKEKLIGEATRASIDAGTLRPDLEVETFVTLAMSVLMGLDQLAMVIDDHQSFASTARGAMASWVRPYRPA